MDSNKLAALISSLISDLLLLLLLFPSNSTDSNSNSNSSLFSILHHQELAASLSILTLSKKRKRTQLSDTDFEHMHEVKMNQLGTRLVELERVVTNPDSFITFFKMKVSTFEWLSGLLEPLLDCRDPIGSPLNLSAELRLGIGLFRLATGSNYNEIADRFGVSESVTRFCVKQLCRVLCTNFRFWVSLPNSIELQSISSGFEKLTNLPNCCGVIDCARFIRMDSNLVVNQDDIISAQIVVDSSSRILSIVAGFRGENGNAKILKSTTLYKDIEFGSVLNSNPIIVNGVAINQYLIGSRNYPLLPWLIVPFLDPLPGSNEEKFNVVIDEMRICSIRTIACLKNWGVLSKPIDEEFKTSVAMIGACSILHNALLMREDDSALIDLDDYSLYDQHNLDYDIENIQIDKKAFDIRSALATRVAEFHNS